MNRPYTICYLSTSADGHIDGDFWNCPAAAPALIDVKNRGAHGVIHVLTEDISDRYLHYLREKGISYIFCGGKELDPVLMMEKLSRLFGVKKAIISGGAYADWTLLSKGLIDEIKFMLLPVADGDPASHTLFKRMPGMESNPVALELVSAERTDGDGLMVTYRPKNIRGT